MLKTNKKEICSLILCFFLLMGCGSTVRDDNFLYDLEWRPELYNMVYVEAPDLDNLSYWVRREPSYEEGTPHLIACIEIKQPAWSANKFYKANIKTYGMVEVYNCDGDYWLSTNIINPKDSLAYDVTAWKPINGISAKFISNNEPFTNHLSEDYLNQSAWETIIYGDVNSNYLRLIFEPIFPVNEYKLTKEGKALLLKMITQIFPMPVQSLTIYGIADSTGGYDVNKKLAEKRAQSAREFIVENGYRHVPIYIRSSVENKLDTKNQRIFQRRVVVEVEFKHDK